MNTYFIKGDEVGYISSEDTQDYGFFIPVFWSPSGDELIEKCTELNKLRFDNLRKHIEDSLEI